MGLRAEYLCCPTPVEPSANHDDEGYSMSMRASSFHATGISHAGAGHSISMSMVAWEGDSMSMSVSAPVSPSITGSSHDDEGHSMSMSVSAPDSHATGSIHDSEGHSMSMSMSAPASHATGSSHDGEGHSMSMSMPASTPDEGLNIPTSGHGCKSSKSEYGSKSSKSKSSKSSHGSKSSKSKFMKESTSIHDGEHSHDGSISETESGKDFFHSDAKAEKYIPSIWSKSTKEPTSKSSKDSKRLFPKTHGGAHTNSRHSMD